jgi:hypothetical protein
VVPIPDKVDIANLDELHWRQGNASHLGGSHARPPPPVVPLERAKLNVKILAPALTAPDLTDRHRAQTRVAPATK